MIDDKKLQDLLDKRDKTSEGPWALGVNRSWGSSIITYYVNAQHRHTCEDPEATLPICLACMDSENVIFEIPRLSMNGEEECFNATFVADAHAAIPELVAEIRDLKKRLRRIVKMDQENDSLKREWTLKDAADIAEAALNEEELQEEEEEHEPGTIPRFRNLL